MTEVRKKTEKTAYSQLNVGDVSYWDVRYTAEKNKWLQFELFDWYVPYSDIHEFIETLVIYHKKKQKILVLGVGRSDIIETLYKYGYRDIIAVDISPTIIHVMSEQYKDYSGVEFMVMDLLEMNSLPPNFFTLIIDKGCLDAVFCRADFTTTIPLALSNIYRLLRDDEGQYISISQAAPICRIPYFRKVSGWSLDSVPLLDGEFLHAHIAVKTDRLDLLQRQIEGGEEVKLSVSTNVTDLLNQSKNKFSNTRKAGQGGNLSVTASADVLMEMVAEIRGKE